MKDKGPEPLCLLMLLTVVYLQLGYNVSTTTELNIAQTAKVSTCEK